MLQPIKQQSKTSYVHVKQLPLNSPTLLSIKTIGSAATRLERLSLFTRVYLIQKESLKKILPLERGKSSEGSLWSEKGKKKKKTK